RAVCLDVLLYPARTVKRSNSTALHRSNGVLYFLYKHAVSASRAPLPTESVVR
ncbi:MAG: hypothetical protein JWQ50_7387, partial [Caballeronia mineralivorans]|nr:hypothetical protein [Caballeronia mineralivorans]MEA3105014.1 hypothetical protein [Caballeronia mineralivorans]